VYLLTCEAVVDENFILLHVFVELITKVWLRFTSCSLSLECLLSVLVECRVSSAGSGPELGKGRVGFLRGQRSGGGVELHRDEGLLNFFLEVSEYGIEDSISRKGGIIIKVVVFSCLSMYVEALYCVDTHLET
jgi:hypothetical protein